VIKHTKGPWRVDDCYLDGENGVLDSEGFEVAEVPYGQLRVARNGRRVYRDITHDEQMANAALIAAAPDLAAALLDAFRFVYRPHQSTRIRAALRKAGVLP